MLPNPFVTAQERNLKEFGEEFLRLAELIILYDKDAWDDIDAAERSVNVKMLMGEKTAFASEKDLKLHFMRLRVNLISKNINENAGVRQAQAYLSRYMNQHSVEVRTFGLAFKNKSLLTPTEIFANYHYLSRKVPTLALADSFKKK